MTVRMLRALPLALGLALALPAAPLMASESGLDFAGAKAKAAAENKLLLVDFSSPT